MYSGPQAAKFAQTKARLPSVGSILSRASTLSLKNILISQMPALPKVSVIAGGETHITWLRYMVTGFSSVITLSRSHSQRNTHRVSCTGSSRLDNPPRPAALPLNTHHRCYTTPPRIKIKVLMYLPVGSPSFHADKSLFGNNCIPTGTPPCCGSSDASPRYSLCGLVAAEERRPETLRGIVSLTPFPVQTGDDADDRV